MLGTIVIIGYESHPYASVNVINSVNVLYCGLIDQRDTLPPYSIFVFALSTSELWVQELAAHGWRLFIKMFVKMSVLTHQPKTQSARRGPLGTIAHKTVIRAIIATSLVQSQ